MAVTRPTSFSRWNTGGANRTEPTAGKKTTGWVLNEQPSSSFFNWLQHFGGLWDEWINERMFDGVPGGGGDSEDLLIHPPTPATAGGKLTAKGADGVGAGSAGGAVDVAGGDAPSGNAVGGAANIDGGAGSGTGNGGFVNITGGPGGATGTGGEAHVEAGTTSDGTGATALLAGGLVTGTDQDGGLTDIRSGVSTGDGSSDIVLRAVDGSQGAGATSRGPSEYLRCDGSAKHIVANRSLVLTATDATRAPARITASARPTTPGRGDTYVSNVADNSIGKSYIHTGSRWAAASSLRVVTTADSNSVSATVVETAFNQKDTIPADFAQVGDLMLIRAGGFANWATGNITLRIRIGGSTTIASHAFTPVAAFLWRIEADLIVANAGATGALRILSTAKLGTEAGAANVNLSDGIGGSPFTVDFTASQDFEITAQWASGAGGNSITMSQFTSDIR